MGDRHPRESLGLVSLDNANGASVFLPREETLPGLPRLLPREGDYRQLASTIRIRFGVAAEPAISAANRVNARVVSRPAGRLNTKLAAQPTEPRG